jgi:hypothetical protein
MVYGHLEVNKLCLDLRARHLSKEEQKRWGLRDGNPVTVEIREMESGRK